MTNPELTPLPYGIVPAPSRRGKGFLAACATIFFPGLGHWIAGANTKAALWFVVMATIESLAVMSLVFAHLLLILVLMGAAAVLSICALIDAYMAGNRSSRTMLRWPLVRYLVAIVLVVLAHFGADAFGVYIKSHWIQGFVFSGRSMFPVLQPGDWLLVTKQQVPKRWDIVVYYPPSWLDHKPRVGRIAGLPGEVVEITSTGLKINGKSANRPPNVGPYLPYLIYSSGIRSSRRLIGCGGHPIQLAGDEYFLLGDNSPVAADSRYWSRPILNHQPGALPADRIIGVATAIYWPPTRWQQLKNWEASVDGREESLGFRIRGWENHFKSSFFRILRRSTFMPPLVVPGNFKGVGSL